MPEEEFSNVFWKIYDAALLEPRYISNKGGTRSTKTYSTLQFLDYLIPEVDKPGDNLCCSGYQCAVPNAPPHPLR